MRLALVLVTAAALGMANSCSSNSVAIPSGQSASDASSKDASDPRSEVGDAGEQPAGGMTLTSSAFVEGATLPARYTCDGGTNDVSPPLSWRPGPEGTQSYAVVFSDKTNGLVHSAIYDIPASATSLPEGVEGKYEPSEPAGAKQSLNYKKQSGYAGPCPPDGEHQYQFALYAVKVATLGGLTKDSTAADVEKAILEQDLAVSKLDTKYTRAQ